MSGDLTRVLLAEQVELWERIKAGELPCPECGEPLEGGFIAQVGWFVGVLLYCTRCSFLEPVSVPARNGVGEEGRRQGDWGDVIELEVEEVLTVEEAELLQKVEQGILPCPWCGQPLRGKFCCFPREEDDFYFGVRLSCSCGFVEF